MKNSDSLSAKRKIADALTVGLGKLLGTGG